MSGDSPTKRPLTRQRPPAEDADIDPTFKALLDSLPAIFNLADGVGAARARVKQLQVPQEMLPSLRIENRTVGYGEHTGIPVRIYWPPTLFREALPVVVFYHGGGWSTGDLDSHDAVARAHCIAADAIVVSVDYRLAPENPFPAGILDSWAALRWVGEHAAEFGGDPCRIAVAGDSAGANISAVMAQLARDNCEIGGPPLVFQLLWYPWTTADPWLPSLTENADAPLLDREAVETFLSWYVPSLDLTDHAATPATLTPATAADLSGLPRAFIGTAGHDSLRDHGAQYAALLAAAGVSVEWSNEANLVHGYVNFADVVPAAAEATKRGLAALNHALHAGGVC
jgi:acetyl esterase